MTDKLTIHHLQNSTFEHLTLYTYSFPRVIYNATRPVNDFKTTSFLFDVFKNSNMSQDII